MNGKAMHLSCSRRGHTLELVTGTKTYFMDLGLVRAGHKVLSRSQDFSCDRHKLGPNP